MNVRTVRLLDRQPGQPSDDKTRTVFGVTLESGIAVPAKRSAKSAARSAMEVMAVGESFLHTHRCKDVALALAPKEFTTRREATGRYRIWRTA